MRARVALAVVPVALVMVFEKALQSLFLVKDCGSASLLGKVIVVVPGSAQTPFLGQLRNLEMGVVHLEGNPGESEFVLRALHETVRDFGKKFGKEFEKEFGKERQWYCLVMGSFVEWTHYRVTTVLYQIQNQVLVKKLADV